MVKGLSSKCHYCIKSHHFFDLYYQIGVVQVVIGSGPLNMWLEICIKMYHLEEITLKYTLDSRRN